MRRCQVFLLFLILLITVEGQSVLAESAPFQPLLGFAWPTHNIPVRFNASLPIAARAVENAIHTWNLAQQWFITTYMAGKGEPLLFYAAPPNSSSNNMITITFNQTQSIQDLGRTNSQEFHDQQGEFAKVIVEISIDLAWKNGQLLTDTQLQTLATHELGHALGLDHTTFSTSDLMNQSPTVSFPSTLNLYAVYLLSQLTNINDIPQQPVTLPGIIPYTTISQTDLDVVTPLTLQTTTSTGLIPLGAITNGPWLYITLLVILASFIVSLTFRSRRSKVNEYESIQSQVIFREDLPTEKNVVQPELTRKKCKHCGTQVPRVDLICRNCGMPLYS